MFKMISTGALSSLLAAVLLAGCAGAPEKNAALEQAEEDYAQAKGNPEVLKYAADTLGEAEASLERAAAAEDADEMSRLAYIGQAQVGTALAITERRHAEQRMQELRAAQEGMQLEAREAELAALKAKRTDRGMVITLGDVLFDVDRATLTPGAMDIVVRLAEFLREHPRKTVLIEGHTDSTGSYVYNQDLSERRAYAVGRALMRRGIDASRISTMGLGESRPLVSNASAAGRQRNRRVEIIIQG